MTPSILRDFWNFRILGIKDCRRDRGGRVGEVGGIGGWGKKCDRGGGVVVERVIPFSRS